MNAVDVSDVAAERAVRRARLRAERRRRTGILILVPTLLTLLYLLLIAPPVFRSHAEFTIQGAKKQQPDLLAGIGIPAASPASNDAHVVVDYLRSAEMVDLLRRRYGFNEAYSRAVLDPANHLSPRAPIEEAVRFWRSHTKIDYDVVSNIVTVTVSAFEPRDAKRLAEGALAGAGLVVNSLDQQVQQGSIQAAAQELADKRQLYEESKRRVASIRGSQAMTLDATAQQAVQTVSQIDAELARLRVQQAATSATYQPGAPASRAVQAQIAALESARAAAVRRAQSGPGGALASSDIAARAALLDYEFAQKSYYSALQASQAANGQTRTDRRYIVAFVPPRLPEQSDYFTRLWNVLAVALGSALLIGTAMLTYSVVKDHMQ